ncbi:condensation domain-containing protein [Xenorhabdus miraniensis]|uniref:Phthiocerol/phthiodiolone dimycocerosyl transferase n=1 Tax=Xenorhabdus miraniensis TaxID=351674 RepID=A0A2D0JJA7_9GAMM|nr:condensation domain-containing protein [Xenorhabdus miraniensis]PHM45540.1 peptide synthase [Xenorhabdus miraniensis]
MTEINRPLSCLERWYWLCDQFSTLNVISRVRVHGELQMTALRHGLDELQVRHPLLRTRIEHDNGLNPRWVSCDQAIPLREIRFAQDQQWVDEVNKRELMERVNPDIGPLIRTVVVNSADGIYDLLVIVPHIIADGTTVLSLAEQWLTLANNPVSSSWIARALPSAEEMRPSKFTGKEGAIQLAEQTAQDAKLMTTHKPGRIIPNRVISPEKRRTQLLRRELNSDQLTLLIQTSRKHGTTVHGALTAALVLAAALDDQNHPTQFAVGSPIDFRRELVPAVSHDEVGTYVATVMSVVNVSQPFWNIARDITTDLAKRKASGHHFNLVNLVADLAPQSLTEARPFMEFMESEGPINLCSSNIGRYEFPDRIGSWYVTGAQFLTGISVNGYFVATINTSHNTLFWNFTYIDDAVPASRATRLADTCVRVLLSALNEPAGTNQ